MVYNRIKLGRLGEGFLPRELLMDVRERRRSLGEGGKLVITRLVVAREGKSKTVEWSIVVSGSMETASTRVNCTVGWIDPRYKGNR